MKRFQTGCLVLLVLATLTLGASASQLTTATMSNVYVNGKQVAFTAFNIDYNNYFKLRDIAQAISGTDNSVQVTWDKELQSILLNTDLNYSPVGGELEAATTSGEALAEPADIKVYLDNQLVDLTAYTIEDNNYFKLRDICEILDLEVTFDETTQNIGINTNGFKTTDINPEVIYARLIAMKAEYPDYSTWDDTSGYAPNTGYYSWVTSSAGFAFLLSDVAFGNNPVVKHYDFSALRVGDILRLGGNLRSVVVLSIEDGVVTVVEGNYMGMVMWGRTMTLDSIVVQAARYTGSDGLPLDYVLTRYP